MIPVRTPDYTNPFSTVPVAAAGQGAAAPPPCCHRKPRDKLDMAATADAGVRQRRCSQAVSAKAVMRNGEVSRYTNRQRGRRTCGATSSMSSAGTSARTTISSSSGLGAKRQWLSASSFRNRFLSATRAAARSGSSLSSAACPAAAWYSSSYSSPRPCQPGRATGQCAF